MKSIVPYLAWLVSLFAVMADLPSAYSALDPNLAVSITRTNQNVVLRWFGSNGVPYQVEYSSDLNAWFYSGLVVTGSDTFISAMNSTVGLNQGFFRIMRVVPDDPWTAAFSFGILTIGANDRDNTVVVSR